MTSGAPRRYVSSSWNETPPYFFALVNGSAAIARWFTSPVKNFRMAAMVSLSPCIAAQ